MARSDAKHAVLGTHNTAPATAPAAATPPTSWVVFVHGVTHPLAAVAAARAAAARGVTHVVLVASGTAIEARDRLADTLRHQVSCVRSGLVNLGHAGDNGRGAGARARGEN